MKTRCLEGPSFDKGIMLINLEIAFFDLKSRFFLYTGNLDFRSQKADKIEGVWKTWKSEVINYTKYGFAVLMDYTKYGLYKIWIFSLVLCCKIFN